MKVVFLGTNGWYDTETGNTPCIFIETEGHYVILDAGFGLQKARSLITSGKPVLLFISHLHLDHLIGLHTLPLFKLRQGIDIYTPIGMARLVRSFLRRPFTSPPLLLQTKVRIRELDSKTRLPLSVETLRLRHSVPCYGYRLTADGKTVAYCTDTGLCSNLKRLASGADLLITECALAPGDTAPNLVHITPETAASVASQSQAKKLALCHFDPGKYPSIADRNAAQRSAVKIFTETIVAEDGTTITL